MNDTAEFVSLLLLITMLIILGVSGYMMDGLDKYYQQKITSQKQFILKHSTYTCKETNTLEE